MGMENDNRQQRKGRSAEFLPQLIFSPKGSLKDKFEVQMKGTKLQFDID